MNSKPHPRHEKNRHHLATVISAVLAAVLLLGVYVVLPPSKWICIASAVVFGLVLFARTLVIESGFRRPLTGAEATFERGVRRRIARWFGITAVEERHSDSDSNHDTSGFRGDA
jgi:hypothetical protein